MMGTECRWTIAGQARGAKTLSGKLHWPIVGVAGEKRAEVERGRYPVAPALVS